MSSPFYKSFDKQAFQYGVIAAVVGGLIIFVNIATFIPLPAWIAEHSTFRFSQWLFLLGLVLCVGGIWGIHKSFHMNFCSGCKIPVKNEEAYCDIQYEGVFTQMVQTGELKNISGLKFVSSSHDPLLEIDVEYCPACVACALVSMYKTENTQTKTILKDQVIIGPVVRTLKDTLLL